MAWKEFFGRVNSKTEEISIARMKSPGGWIEPGQTPEFDEYSIILKGMLRIATRENSIDLHEGQGALSHRGEWVQYSTPSSEGAEYISICLPAFSPILVHRDQETGKDDL
jgi:mannose-6-phosphate isomerase-like protein (cupin superfamily)